MEVDQHQAELFVRWLQELVIREARGNAYDRLPVGPSGRFWLGRLAPEETVQNSPLGERAERLMPCATGIRVRPTQLDGRVLKCTASMAAWREIPDHQNGPTDDKWQKTDRIDVSVDVETPTEFGQLCRGGYREITEALRAVGVDGLAAEIQAEIENGQQGPELVVTIVNVSPENAPGFDTNLYEVELVADVGRTEPFLLDSLPDSFRYDRRVPAYGVNGGVIQKSPTTFSTSDFTFGDRLRPKYWDAASFPTPPDLTFSQLAIDPLPELHSLVTYLDIWTRNNWDNSTIENRAKIENWSSAMLDEAKRETTRARDEVDRLRNGLRVLESDTALLRAFSLANEAFEQTISINYDAWRPFQLGFVLANVASLSEGSAQIEREFLDTIWFATGGGKTETYLLFTVTAAFLDRLRGKKHGITTWGRFPLRMLSLQQTQRFADVLAAAELIRQRRGLTGDAFGLGFFVGSGGSPNRVEKMRPNLYLNVITDVDLQEPEVRRQYQVLIQCPFCASTNLEMRFNKALWSLQHFCTSDSCSWGGSPLPMYVVDEEIYRWLPTVVLGTLDKAANVSRQAAMRGFYGAPSGLCPINNHGFTYAPRSRTPKGCLYPGCQEQPETLPQPTELFAPTIRMQDELHLLRDSLGSIDAHYEALLDSLQHHWGSQPKLIGSSATLSGHAEQARALYRRDSRMFPVPGPAPNESFWTQETDNLARRYVGLAPRGVTLEYANDQLGTTLQEALRRALAEPHEVASDIGVPEASIEGLVWAYGIDVVYGSTLKDVEAAARSFESQIPIADLNSGTLTGRTPLSDVRSIIDRVKNPEPDFADRIHMIAASSMLSHGVDLDRLNVMVILGLPLSTAEFIQTTARVGRAHPGLVFVLHKIGRERDAAVFRTFPSFIQHMDRLVDPVPITSKSRRVLELTFSGLELGRIQGVHEPSALANGLRQLTTVSALRLAFTRLGVNEKEEMEAMVRTLGFDKPLDAKLRDDLELYFREFYRALNDPASTAQWPSQLFPGGEPMLSLRDVEQQIPVYDRGNR